MGTKQNIYLLVGVAGIVIGVMTGIPALFKEYLVLAMLSVFLVLGGLVALAHAWGDEDNFRKTLELH